MCSLMASVWRQSSNYLLLIYHRPKLYVVRGWWVRLEGEREKCVLGIRAISSWDNSYVYSISTLYYE